jgi:tape measure domain-containing protein
MAQVVEYILGLRDNLTGGINNANNAAQRLEGTLSSIGAAMGVTFGIAGITMFGKAIVDAGTKVEDAKTGLTTLLGDAVKAQGVIDATMKDAMATPFAFDGLLMANKALISAGVESTRARQDVLNLSNAIAATGGGDAELQRMVVNLQQISNTGKATTLDIKQFAYAGVNIYKVLEAAGIKANGKGKELEITYDQITMALKRAHEAGGMYYNGLENMAANTSVKISNLGDAFFQLRVNMFNDLKPTIESIIGGLMKFIGVMKDAWDWCVKNGVMLKFLAKGFLVAVVAFKAMTIIPPLLLAIENAMVAAAMGGATFGASMLAALGPIALVAVAVGGLVATFGYLGDKIKEASEERNKFLDTSRTKEIEYLKEVVEARGGGQKNIDAVAEEEKARLRLENKNLRDLQNNSETWRGYEIDKQIGENIAKMNAVDQFQQGLLAPKTLKSPLSKNTTAAAGKVKDTSKTKAVGQKSVTINVSIKDLIGVQNINTTNLKEGAGKIKDLVVAALTGAVNDFQIVAGH